MKAVMISIQPKWVEKIMKGEKTIEVRKTAPKLETPFKCYIYKTKATKLWSVIHKGDHFYGQTYDKTEILSFPDIDGGKVIGEFICDRIDDFYCASVPYIKENNLGYEHFIDNGVYKVNGWFEGVVFERNDRYLDTMLNNNDLKEMCLSAQDIFDYIGIGKHLYGLHISNLKIYDKPKEIGEFRKPCVDKYKYCQGCIHGLVTIPPDEEEYAFYNGGSYEYFDTHCTNYLKKPPQSWYYVEI